MGRTRIVIRNGGLGDLILLYPALKVLHERHGGPITLVTGSGLVEVIYRHCPDLAASYLVKGRRLPKFLNLSLRKINKLAEGELDCVYNFDERTSRAGTFAKLEKRAGYRFASLGFPGRGREEHEADFRLRLIGDTPEMPRVTAENFAAGVKPELPVTDAEVAECEAWIGGLGLGDERRLLVQPGNHKTTKMGPAERATNRKYWSEAKWAEVIEGAVSGNGCGVLLCGAPPEHEWLDSILEKCEHKSGVVNVSRDLPIRRLMALARMPGSCYVGVDTGPAHLAVAMGCPAAILYGPSSVVNYRPLSWGQLVLPLEKLGGEGQAGGKRISPDIGLISTEEVIAAVNRLLSEGAHPDSEEYRTKTLISLP